MPFNRYKVWAFGNAVGRGVTGAFHVGVAGVAKRATMGEPYIVANEMVCNGIARCLLLPCPPGDLIEKDGEPHFFSLDFNLAGVALPPITPADVVAQDHRLCWGIILFDALMMNTDRHTQNIAHDRSTGRVQIFDHSHAFVAPAGDVSARLASLGGQLAIGGHCLATVINTMDGQAAWLDRIEALPDFFIDGILDAACEVGLPSDKKNECAAFLKARRAGLRALVAANPASFPNLHAVLQ